MEETFDISMFAEYEEDNRKEVKAAEGGLPSSLWDTYSSMANTYGGVIICGVRERGDGSWFTTGMKDVSNLKKNFWNQANDSKKVSMEWCVWMRHQFINQSGRRWLIAFQMRIISFRVVFVWKSIRIRS